MCPSTLWHSYFLAMQDGADFVEPDLVMTRDGVLVARHENEIGGTTDVAAHPEFAARRTTQVIDGTSGRRAGSPKTSRSRSSRPCARASAFPTLRPANTRFDGQFEIPTFEEILALVQGVEGAARTRARGSWACRRRRASGSIRRPSTRVTSPALGLAMEEPLVATLERYGYRGAARAGLAAVLRGG